MTPVSKRDALRQAQRSLIEALAGTNNTPTDFVGPGLEVARDSLLKKRLRGIEKAWPEVPALLGEPWRTAARQYADATGAQQSGDDAQVDGARFIVWAAANHDSRDPAWASRRGLILILRSRLVLEDRRCILARPATGTWWRCAIVWVWRSRQHWRVIG